MIFLKENIYNLSIEELKSFLIDLGEKPFRANQIWNWLYVKGIDNIEEIAAVPGLDVLFLGMWDLCLSHGLNPIDMPFAETDAIVERVRRVGRESGVAVGTGFSDQNHLRKCISEGYTWLASLPDYAMMTRAAQTNVTAFREETAK